MKQTQDQIEHLRTIRETSSFWADVAENQLPALADKIDNIKLPEIDTSELAKQGENAEATNSKILEEIENVKETTENINIPLSAISGLALELEGGKKNIANALKARGVEASVESDTLTDLAEKVYEVKNPVAFTVPAETSNEWANSFFNTMMKSQGLDQMYATVVETYVGENKPYVGCLMTFLEKTKDSIELKGADAYYIWEDDTFYMAGENGNLVQILNGVATQLSNKYHVWNIDDTRSTRCVFYLYLEGSTADGIREDLHNSIIDYCHNATIPVVTYGRGGGIFIHIHLANPDTCIVKYSGGSPSNTRTIYFYCNVENCTENMDIYGTDYNNSSQLLFLGLPNLKKIVGQCYVMNGGKVRNIDFGELEEVENNASILNTYTNISNIEFPKLRTLNDSILLRSHTSSRSNEITISLPACEVLYQAASGNNAVFVLAPHIVHLYLKDGIKVGRVIQNVASDDVINNVKELHIHCQEIYKDERYETRYPNFGGINIYFEGLKKADLWFGNTASYSCFTRYIYINCIGDRTDEIKFARSSGTTLMTLVTDIEISQGARQPLYLYEFHQLTAENIVNHIFERLADNNFEDDGVTPAPAITITIGSYNLEKLTDEQKAIATDKNYILA